MTERVRIVNHMPRADSYHGYFAAPARRHISAIQRSYRGHGSPLTLAAIDTIRFITTFFHGVTMKKTTLRQGAATLLASAAFAALLTAPAAQAQTAPAGPPKLEWSFDNGSKVRLYGQINKGILQYDDGQETQSYGLIDNANSNTRLGLTYDHTIGQDWDYTATIELQYAPFSSNNTNLLRQTPPAGAYDFSNANIRLIDNQFANKKYGTFSIGQGNMASQNTAKVDLSGTSVINSSAVDDTAGGQLMRQSDGTLSSVRIRDAFSAYNGLGRKVRIRYDTPSFSNFTISASYGRDLLADTQAVRDVDLYDVAVDYTNTFNDFRVSGELSYADAGNDTNILSSSGSLLHTPTGLSLTLAGGSQDKGDLTGTYGFVKLGWQHDFIAMGTTAFAVDYYKGTDILSDGSKSDSTGISVVQNITNYGTQLWLTYRDYSLSEQTVSYQDSSALFGGLRFRF